MHNWDDIRHFLAIVRHGSLQAAANALGVDQSTVFRRLRALEDYLGTHVFDRRKRGRYVLTAAGESLLDQARRMEDATLDIDRSVRGQDLQLSGPIRVATAEDLAATLLPRHLAEFERAFPDINIELLTANRYYSLARNEADVAIRPGFSTDEDRVIPRRIRSVFFGLFASADYLEQYGTPHSVSDLKQHRAIEWREDLARDHFTADAIAWFGGTHHHGSNSLLTQCALAAEGLGVAVLPEFLGLQNERLQPVLPGVRIDSGFLWLLHHDDVRHTARFRAFSEFMLAALRNDRRFPVG